MFRGTERTAAAIYYILSMKNSVGCNDIPQIWSVHKECVREQWDTMAPDFFRTKVFEIPRAGVSTIGSAHIQKCFYRLLTSFEEYRLSFRSRIYNWRVGDVHDSPRTEHHFYCGTNVSGLNTKISSASFWRLAIRLYVTIINTQDVSGLNAHASCVQNITSLACTLDHKGRYHK